MEISIGYYSLPVILTVILGVIYKTVPAPYRTGGSR